MIEQGCLMNDSAKNYTERMCQLLANKLDSLHPYQYLLKYGKQFEKRIPYTKTGLMGQCYENSYNIARGNSTKFTYVEGIATALIPRNHAWVVDEEGNIFDNTPCHDSDSYFGCEFTIDEVKKLRRAAKCRSIFDSWPCWSNVLKVLLKTHATRQTEPYRESEDH